MRYDAERAGLEPASDPSEGPYASVHRMAAVEFAARLVYQVDVTVCPRCGGEMRILAFMTESAVIPRILAHLERRGVDARAEPWVGAG